MASRIVKNLGIGRRRTSRIDAAIDRSVRGVKQNKKKGQKKVK